MQTIVNAQRYIYMFSYSIEVAAFGVWCFSPRCTSRLFLELLTGKLERSGSCCVDVSSDWKHERQPRCIEFKRCAVCIIICCCYMLRWANSTAPRRMLPSTSFNSFLRHLCCCGCCKAWERRGRGRNGRTDGWMCVWNRNIKHHLINSNTRWLVSVFCESWLADWVSLMGKANGFN